MGKEDAVAPRVRYSATGGEVATLAARDLASGLSAMLGAEGEMASDTALPRTEIRIDLSRSVTSAHAAAIANEGDSFDVSREGDPAGSIVIRAASERGLIHAATDLLEKLGAQFAPGVAPSYPRIDPARVSAIEPFRVTPAFTRRAFVSDIMTWNYKHARPSRAASRTRSRIHSVDGARAASTRSRTSAMQHDTRLKIDELLPLLHEHGIGVRVRRPRPAHCCCRAIASPQHPEYLPGRRRRQFATRAAISASRIPSAVAIVCEGALALRSRIS